MCKILFVYTNINVRGGHAQALSGAKVPSMHLGIASVSSLLKKHGHICELLLITESDYRKDVENKMNQFAPDIVAFTCVSTQFPYIIELSRFISKTYPDLFQICGGSHVTLAPEESLIDSELDAVCVGEGEYPMLELANALSRRDEYSGIKNLYFKTSDGKICKNDIRSFNQDLDLLPFLDRELYEDYVDLATYPHSVLTTRGCIFNCNYCCNHVYRKIATGKYVRTRSAENVVAEIEELKGKYPRLSYLYVVDETVGQNSKSWEKLLPGLKGTGLKFGANYRIGVSSLDFLDKLRDANFVKIEIGIESGNEWLRKTVLNRRYKNGQIIEAFRRAKELGMTTRSYNLIGLPYETPELFEDTIKINQEVRPDSSVLNFFYPYPGTKLDKMCDELGLKPKVTAKSFRERTESILDLPDFPKEELMKCFDRWNALVNPRSIWTMPRRIYRAFRREPLTLVLKKILRRLRTSPSIHA